MRPFHRAGLFSAGLIVLAGTACLIGHGSAVAQSDLEMPADPSVLSKPYRSTVPIFRRRAPPDAVPTEAAPPAAGWREPPGRIGVRDGAAPDAAPEAPMDSGFGPVRTAPAHDLAPEEEPEERPAAPSRPVRAAAPKSAAPKAAAPRAEPPEEAGRVTRRGAREEREPPARETARAPEADEEDAAPAYAGVWGPSATACASRRSARRGFLPAVIRPGSAQAGKTLCRFRDTRREGRSWVTTASCQTAARRWTSRVRLTVSGNRLVWASERGSATYTRCSGG